MIQKLIIDKVLKLVLKEFAKQIKPLQKYVDEPNDLDKKIEGLEHRMGAVESVLKKKLKNKK